MFLPDYLLKRFDSTFINRKQLVLEKKEILKPFVQENKSFLLSPFIIFAILFVVIGAIGFFKNTNRLFSFFDFILFFLCGITGILILFMWLVTDHLECRNNFIVALAVPFHVFGVFVVYTNRRWL